MNANFSHLNQPLVLKNALIKNRLFFPNALPKTQQGTGMLSGGPDHQLLQRHLQRMAQR